LPVSIDVRAIKIKKIIVIISPNQSMKFGKYFHQESSMFIGGTWIEKYNVKD